MAQNSSSQTPFYASLVSISLVLFFLGLFALLTLGGKVIVDTAKEELEMKVMLIEGTTDQQGQQLAAQLRASSFAKDASYHSRQEILKNFKDLGDDFIASMDGLNPFLSAVTVQLTSDYIQSDSIRAITQQLLHQTEVAEVDYPIVLIEKVNNRLGLLTTVAILLGLLLIIIAYLLILNTVKLAIFSKRMIIRSMQLIGATNHFIRRPFIRMGVLQGLFAGLVADLGLGILLFVFHHYFLNIDRLTTSLQIRLLFVMLIAFGVLLGWFSSTRAVNKFLTLKLDQLA